MAHVTSQSKIQKIFQESPILAYRGNNDLKQIIRNNSIEDNQKKKRVKKNYHSKCYPLLSNSRAVLSASYRNKIIQKHTNKT